MAFSTVISCKYKGNIEAFEFDILNSKTVTLDSDITTHPLINGDIVADHMYNNPISLTLSGTFSMNGNKKFNYGNEERLEEIQKVFETIKREGIPCTIITQNSAGDKRFSVRNNMILNSISWTELQNSMNFTFSFTEIQFVDLDEVEYDVNIEDDSLPNVTNPKELEFTSDILNWEQIDIFIVNLLHDEHLIDDIIYTKYLTENNPKSTALEITGITLGSALLSGIVIGNTFGSLPGAVVGTAIGAIVFFGSLIYNEIKKQQYLKDAEKYKIQVFKDYNDDLKNQKEVERLSNFVGTIHQSLSELNEYLLVYGLTFDDSQTCSLYIDNKYYTFDFIKNKDFIDANKKGGLQNLKNIKSHSDYSLNVTVLDDDSNKQIKSIQNISGEVKLSIDECKSNNSLFRTSGSGYYVYLINLKLSGAKNLELNQRDAIASDLTNYKILVSKINLDEFNEKLSEIILNSLLS